MSKHNGAPGTKLTFLVLKPNVIVSYAQTILLLFYHFKVLKFFWYSEYISDVVFYLNFVTASELHREQSQDVGFFSYAV